MRIYLGIIFHRRVKFLIVLNGIIVNVLYHAYVDYTHRSSSYCYTSVVRHDSFLQLEELFGAQTLGLSHLKRTEMQTSSNCPEEVVITYDPSPHTSDPTLFKQLQQIDASENAFRRYFETSRDVLADVGPCASDLVWRYALPELERQTETWYEIDDSEISTTLPPNAKCQIQIRDMVKNWTFAMPNLDSNSRGFNVTPKFLLLLRVLKLCKPYGGSFRAIVFVKRSIARILTEVLRIVDDQSDFLRPYALIDQCISSEGRHLQEVFQNFELGTYNLLVTTQSYEDIGLPRASAVISYDLFDSQVSQAYARACTRGRGSHLVHMLERDNGLHRQILLETSLLDPQLIRWANTIRYSAQERGFLSPDYEDDGEVESLKDPTTGARIYPQDATAVLYRYASSLDRWDATMFPQPLFEFRQSTSASSNVLYSCTVHLPRTPADGISGPPCFSKAYARRAACFIACRELFKAGDLLYLFFPLTRGQIGSPVREAERAPDIYSSALPMKGEKEYGTRFFWDNTLSAPNNILYPTVIFTHHQTARLQNYGPIVLLTRLALPEFAPFKIFFAGISANIQFRKGQPFEIDQARLDDIHQYTVRLCRVVANKPFQCPSNMPYFFAPLSIQLGSLNSLSDGIPIADSIPWNLVKLAATEWALPLKTGAGLRDDLEDALILDRWTEFTRRYEVVTLRTDLTPQSKPEDSVREASYENLLDFCKSKRKGFDGLRDCNQPIIEVSPLPTVINHLNPTAWSTGEPAKATAKSSTMRMALLLPSITKRIDDILLVKELNSTYFDNALNESLLHAAISPPSAAIEYDYERLELFGDAFLKYLSSIYVFVTHPIKTEGALHMARQKIISNLTLLHASNSIGLPPFIQSKPFTIRAWRPPNFIAPLPPRGSGETSHHPDGEGKPNTEGADNPEALRPKRLTDNNAKSLKNKDSRRSRRKKHDEKPLQWLGDKAVADVAEAIMGAAYLSGGRETALQVCKALHVPIYNIGQWSDFGRKVLVPPAHVTAKLKSSSIEAVERIIGHKFNRPHLLAQALTHTSLQGHETSYERLEFLGDGVLDFMVVRHIFDRDQQLSPGGLTLLKSAMVSNSALGAVCVSSGLQKHLMLESYQLVASIQSYAKQLNLAQTEEYRVAALEGRPPGQYWLDIESPKVLSDVIESIIGALYLSDDLSSVGAEALFNNVLKPFYDKHITLKTLSHHPTKTLFELFQARGCQRFKIAKERIHRTVYYHVLVHDVVLATAEETTPNLAARRASLAALDALDGDPAFLNRTCDCRTQQHPWKQKKQADAAMLLEIEDDEYFPQVESGAENSPTQQ
ncbi:hypothetical protein BD779DRAFT_1608060 [Infundibulicybe gibba]|nr:hypothetical protein BD779DRAFT_1608060 [Infundibulicybe gibba]